MRAAMECRHTQSRSRAPHHLGTHDAQEVGDTKALCLSPIGGRKRRRGVRGMEQCLPVATADGLSRPVVRLRTPQQGLDGGVAAKFGPSPRCPPLRVRCGDIRPCLEQVPRGLDLPLGARGDKRRPPTRVGDLQPLAGERLLQQPSASVHVAAPSCEDEGASAVAIDLLGETPTAMLQQATATRCVPPRRGGQPSGPLIGHAPRAHGCGHAGSAVVLCRQVRKQHLQDCGVPAFCSHL
mmetsp:Transcript_4996/g.14666  ORF Transcript_4996/g.14666 Transcript_4996/m.14666 type:complete len:238 (+) Transcript_4996:45-758(+)